VTPFSLELESSFSEQVLNTDRWLLIETCVQDKLMYVTAQCDGLPVRTGVSVPQLEHEATVEHVAALLVSVLPLEDAGHLGRLEVLTAVLLVDDTLSLGK